MVQEMTDLELVEWAFTRRNRIKSPIARETIDVLCTRIQQLTRQKASRPQRTWREAWGLFDSRKTGEG